MIFLTLGTQLPFDRLVEAVDQAAKETNEEVFGQIGKASYRPKHFEFVNSLQPVEFSNYVKKARLIIGHAGIGTLLAGMKAEKPVLLMARRAALREHRNDHQMATANQVQYIPGVQIVETYQDIVKYISLPELPKMENKESEARSKLVSFLQHEIATA